MTLDEIKQKPTDELEALIKTYDLMQNGAKLLINAYYGASGSNWFYFYDPTIAQSITLQGQDLIKFSIQAMNHFFRNKWPVDKELHEKLGISQYEIRPIDTDAVIYVDTDSNFVCFEPLIQSIVGMPEMSDDETLEFCLKIDELGIKPYLKRAFEKYAEKFNTDNRQDFELENASTEGIWLAKKNYIINVAYVDNEKRALSPASKRFQVIKGLEYVKGSYPKWAREHLLKLYQILIKRGRQINVDEHLIPMMREIKAEYQTLHVDAITFNINFNELDKYIIDLDTLQFAKGITPVPRGVAYHNYLIRKTENQRIRELTPGQKVKKYLCDPTQNNLGADVFCYAPGEFPEEFAPPIDREQQFLTLIVDPINRFLEAYKMVPLDSNLNRVIKIVKSSAKKPIPKEKYYPLHVVNKVTLESTEIPAKFNKYFPRPANLIMEGLEPFVADVSPEDFGEYLGIITMYDLNTEIVPNVKLDGYIKAKKKKQDKANAESLAEFGVTDDDDAEKKRPIQTEDESNDE